MSKTPTKRQKSILRSPFFIVFFVFLIGTLVGLFYQEDILSIPGLALVRNDDLPADYDHIVVLMGDASGRRAKAAFDLWKKHPQARISYMREKPEGFVAMGLAKGRDDLHTDYFLRAGVPPSQLLDITECLTTSTLDEARCVKTHLQSSATAPTALVVVTEWYHSSRAGWLFEQIFADTTVSIRMVPAAAEDSSKGVKYWWRDEEMFLRVFEEYLKWTYWRLKGLL